jgi:inward rectifier potassium channel
MTGAPKLPWAPPRAKPTTPPRQDTSFIRKGIARIDLHDPYYFAVSLDWTRFVLLFLAAELALNLTFAALYTLQPGAIANEPHPGLLSAFFFSLETLATVGYGEMYPGTTYGHVISSIEIVVGTVFTAIMTGLLFIRFSKPKAKILYAENPVVAQHNGKPTLMVRIANGRNTVLSNAELSLHMLVRTTSEEGVAHAYVVELPLLRDRIPAFAILFTMMHVIDEASPLDGYHAAHEDLAAVRLFLNVRAHDPAIGQMVADSRAYSGPDIRFGMRYVDAVLRDDNDRVVADYARLGVLVADQQRSDGSVGGLM